MPHSYQDPNSGSRWLSSDKWPPWVSYGSCSNGQKSGELTARFARTSLPREQLTAGSLRDTLSLFWKCFGQVLLTISPQIYGSPQGINTLGVVLAISLNSNSFNLCVSSCESGAGGVGVGLESLNLVLWEMEMELVGTKVICGRPKWWWFKEILLWTKMQVVPMSEFGFLGCAWWPPEIRGDDTRTTSICKIKASRNTVGNMQNHGEEKQLKGLLCHMNM